MPFRGSLPFVHLFLSLIHIYDDEGLMRSGTLVRHLILPLRTSESLGILDAIARELPPGTPVSLMRCV